MRNYEPPFVRVALSNLINAFVVSYLGRVAGDPLLDFLRATNFVGA